MRLNMTVRGDLEWWRAFVEGWNGISIIRLVEGTSPFRVMHLDRGDVQQCGEDSGFRSHGQSGNLSPGLSLLSKSSFQLFYQLQYGGRGGRGSQCAI